MTRQGNPARLVIALSVAGILAVFLLYTSIADATPSLRPSQLRGHTEKVSLAGKVVGSAERDKQGVYRFWLRDVQGTSRVRVLYDDSLPDQFKPNRDIVLDGRLRNGLFVGVPGTLVTRCPSKYSDKEQ
ncbi:MAG: cytochrome c maturation protein CcmE [Actinobacteria bacterium]|nr:cytochrome c maturation protein CcmE [Actinomycetota bacterium]